MADKTDGKPKKRANLTFLGSVNSNAGRAAILDGNIDNILDRHVDNEDLFVGAVDSNAGPPAILGGNMDNEAVEAEEAVARDDEPVLGHLDGPTPEMKAYERVKHFAPIIQRGLKPLTQEEIDKQHKRCGVVCPVCTVIGDKDAMICCVSPNISVFCCEQFFHPTCIGLRDSADGPDGMGWLCHDCAKDNQDWMGLKSVSKFGHWYDPNKLEFDYKGHKYEEVDDVAGHEAQQPPPEADKAKATKQPPSKEAKKSSQDEEVAASTSKATKQPPSKEAKKSSQDEEVASTSEDSSSKKIAAKAKKPPANRGKKRRQLELQSERSVRPKRAAKKEESDDEMHPEDELLEEEESDPEDAEFEKEDSSDDDYVSEEEKIVKKPKGKSKKRSSQENTDDEDFVKLANGKVVKAAKPRSWGASALARKNDRKPPTFAKKPAKKDSTVLSLGGSKPVRKRWNTRQAHEHPKNPKQQVDSKARARLDAIQTPIENWQNQAIPLTRSFDFDPSNPDHQALVKKEENFPIVCHGAFTLTNQGANGNGNSGLNVLKELEFHFLPPSPQMRDFMYELFAKENDGLGPLGYKVLFHTEFETFASIHADESNKTEANTKCRKDRRGGRGGRGGRRDE